MFNQSTLKKSMSASFALLVYASLSAAFFGVGVLNHLFTVVFGNSSDSISFIWAFNWWYYALTHGLNPFFVNSVWYPYNYNLAQQGVLIWGNFILAAPVLFLLGPVATYNLTVIFMSALSAWTAYLLYYYLNRAFWPALFGGYFYGFSSYMIGHSFGHPMLVTLFLIPLIVLNATKFYQKQISTSSFLLQMTLMLTLQFYISLETFATGVCFGFLGLILVLFFYREKEKIFKLMKYLGISLAITLILISPYLYLFFHNQPAYNVFPSAISYSNDLLNPIIPSNYMLLKNHFTSEISGKFSFGDGYFGLPLLILLGLFSIEFWRKKKAKLIVSFIVLTFIASIGPVLHVAGKSIFYHMPWFIALHLPFIKHALPQRFSLYIALALGMMVSYWLVHSRYSIAIKSVLIALSVLFTLPNLNYAHRAWTRHLTVPSFISQKTYQRYIKRGDVVVILPYANYGNGMLWQMKTHMYFKMAGGYLGYTPVNFILQPIVQAFFNYAYKANDHLADNPKLVENFKNFVKQHHVSAIMVYANRQTWRHFFKGAGLTPIDFPGLDLYLTHAYNVAKAANGSYVTHLNGAG